MRHCRDCKAPLDGGDDFCWICERDNAKGKTRTTWKRNTNSSATPADVFMGQSIYTRLLQLRDDVLGPRTQAGKPL